jgi:hypothetical protein
MHLQRQKDDTFKYRNFILVKCILEILKRGVPRELYHQRGDNFESYSDLIKS